MNEIVCKDMIETDLIEGEFVLYVSAKGRLPSGIKYNLYKSKGLLKHYELNAVNHTAIERGTVRSRVITGIYEYFEDLIRERIIPKRYLPVKKSMKCKEMYFVCCSYVEYGKEYFEEVTKHYSTKKQCKKYITQFQKDYDSKLEIEGHIPEYEILIFKESVISLLIQKGLSQDIINLFIELNKEKGNVSFDTYIDNWSAKLIKEFF